MNTSQPFTEGFAGQAGADRAPRQSRRTRMHDMNMLVHLDDSVARVTNLVRTAAKRIRREPVISVAAAAGVGFVIGGALSFRAGRLILAAVARRMGRDVLRQLL